MDRSEGSCTSADGEDSDNNELDIEKMKGDAIGDTVYSERYVLKILMQLSEYTDEKWTEELESDLCVLWDMTASPAVVSFVCNHEFLNSIVSTVEITSNYRMLEIMLGMLGNLCCVETVREKFHHDLRLPELLMRMLACPDSQALIQLARCYQSFTWDLLRGRGTLASDQHWFENQIVSSDFGTRIAQILSNSLCEELLTAFLDLLYTLCGLELDDKDFSHYLATPDMLEAMLECWSQLFRGCLGGSRFEFVNKRTETSAGQWASVLLAFAGQPSGRQLLGECAKRIVTAMLPWLREPDDGSDNLLITTISLMEALVSFYFCPEVFCKTVRIVRKMTERNRRRQEEGEMSVLSLKESFGNYCVEVMKCVERQRLETVLSENCNAQSIRFFWQIVQERDPDCSSYDRSR